MNFLTQKGLIAGSAQEGGKTSLLFIQGFLAAESNLRFNHHFPLLFSRALCASATIRELLTLFQAQLYTLSQTNFSQESFHLL